MTYFRAPKRSPFFFELPRRCLPQRPGSPVCCQSFRCRSRAASPPTARSPGSPPAPSARGSSSGTRELLGVRISQPWTSHMPRSSRTRSPAPTGSSVAPRVTNRAATLHSHIGQHVLWYSVRPKPHSARQVRGSLRAANLRDSRLRCPNPP